MLLKPNELFLSFRTFSLFSAWSVGVQTSLIVLICGQCWKNKRMHRSSWEELSLMGGWPQPQRRVSSGESLSRAAASPCQEKPDGFGTWLGNQIRMWTFICVSFVLSFTSFNPDGWFRSHSSCAQTSQHFAFISPHFGLSYMSSLPLIHT